MKAENDVRVAIPFDIGVKGAGIGPGYSRSDVTRIFDNAVQNEIAEKQQNGLPVARYDAGDRRAYLEYADGTREYVNG